MTKSDLIKELERIPGDPEISVSMKATKHSDPIDAKIDRINEFPRPEIIIVEK